MGKVVGMGFQRFGRIFQGLKDDCTEKAANEKPSK
jgi:hypothetical protein